MDTLQDSINWPCELPNETKKAIVLNAIKIQSLGNSAGHSGNLKGLLYIKKGIAGIGFGSEQTNTMNSSIFGAGDWLGGSIMNNNIRVHVNIEQLEPLEIIFFAKEKLDTLAARDPHIFQFLYHASLKTQNRWLLAQAVSLYKREARVVFSLLEISKHSNQIKGSLTAIHTSQKQLSTITGISRPRLNEVLKMLESTGEISVNRGSIHILDQARLAERLTDLQTSVVDQS
ncbi:helix-turn-helix domain-containing protein [Vibrio sp. RE86]|uniref:Crp/Fnr family transcriptional regulator n=1 Tax=Vibrio sp. RE86 TaxID=2607605 RepID=UPI001493556B